MTNKASTGTHMNTSAWAGRVLQSIPATYTVVYDNIDAVYRAESNGRSGDDYSGAVAQTVINNAFSNLTGGRTWKEKVLLKGNFTFTGPIQIPSFTILEIQGKITLADASNDEVIENAHADLTGDSYIDIVGGEIDGDGAHQSFGAGYFGAGIKFINVDYSSIQDCYIHDTYNAGIYWFSGGFDVTNAYNQIDHCHVNNTFATGAGTALGCATLGRWARGWVSNCTFRSAADFGGLTLDESTDCHIINNTIRDNVRAGLIIEGTDAGYKNANHEIIGNWIYDQSGAAGYGVNVLEDLNGLVIKGNHVMANAGTGIRMEGSDYCVISSNVVKNNAQSVVGSSGILLIDSAGACLRNIIEGNQCFDSQGVATQAYGIRELNNADYNIIMGNNCYLNTTAQIAYLGAHSIIRNNVGYITENSGTSAIISGQTHVHVTHGCSYTPAAADITITPTASSTADPTFYLWVSDITSTEFQVHCTVDPGILTLPFSWAVRKV